MIASRLLRRGLLSAAIFSGVASAVGLGEITLHSRIGEALRADVPLIAGGEFLDAACFSLGPVANADFPVVTTAQTRLLRMGQEYRLILSGSKPINDPIVVINLRAGCGLDLHREYVLLPAPPPSANDTDIEPTTAVAPIAKDVRPRRKAIDHFADARQTAPDPSSPAASEPRKTRAPKKKASKPRAPLARDTLAGIADGKDRIVLGAALDDLPPPSAGDPLAPVYELDARLLKMETTLHLLNQEVDKLSTAATLAAESRAMRDKLQDMQEKQTTPGVPETPPHAPVRATPGQVGWLELLLGVLLGGGVSAGAAHLVSRKQDKGRPFDAPPPRIAKPRQSPTA